MKISFWTGTSIVIAAAIMLAGCAAPPPKDFGGRWIPVNRFQSTPIPIPLKRAYVYYASPLDGTLKTMLTRWAKDTGMTLVYELPDDYTLFTPVEQIHTSDANVAMSRLGAIYAAENVSVTTRGRDILVQSVDAANSAPSGKQATAANETEVTSVLQRRSRQGVPKTH